jgi:hypothetical protein
MSGSLQEVMSKIRQKAGLDFEARPMVVISACHFPDAKLYNYDSILEYLMSQMDEFVENDYVIVLFTAGMEHRPPLMWYYKAYKALNRKYKKNLKLMYVVHPNRWVKLIMDAMKAVISPKFAKKLVHCKTLTELASSVPYRQIKVPDAVLNHNMELEPMVSIPERSSSSVAAKVFGLPLGSLMGDKGNLGVPHVIVFCLDYIRANGMETEGIFRRSPSSLQLKQVKKVFDEGGVPNMEQYDSPVHIAAVLVKLFFRDLPSPLFPPEMYSDLPRIYDQGSIGITPKVLAQTLESLPANNLILFLYLLVFLHELTRDGYLVTKHKMTPGNLSVVIAPNLVRCADPLAEMEISRCVGNVLKACLEQYPGIQTAGSIPSLGIDNEKVSLSEAFDIVKALAKNGMYSKEADASNTNDTTKQKLVNIS